MNGGRAVVADASQRAVSELRRERRLAGAEGGDSRQGAVQQPRRPTFLSLFTGIGGLDLALEHLGWRCVGQVEWDAHCRSVLERHWPAVPRWGDIAEFGAASYRSRHADRGTAEEPRPDGERARSIVDAVVGGFPCQPVSHAGQRRAQADERWLWPEFARVIRELGPQWVVVENVPGLLSAGDPHGSAFGEVLRDLASLGFSARWTCVRASDTGAPHRRERFFLVAPADGGRRIERDQGQRGLPEPDSLGDDAPHPDELGGLWEQEPPGIEGPSGDEPDGRVRDGELGVGTWGPYAPAIERWERVMGPAPAPLDDGRLSADFVEWMMALPHGWTHGKRNQRLKALGNAVVWPQAVHALRQLALSVTQREGMGR